MAVLDGLHIVCSRAGGPGFNGNNAQVLNGIEWSETIASGGTSTQATPTGNAGAGDPLLHLIAAVDGWVAFGVTPNSAANPRLFIRADDPPVDILVPRGVKVAFTADA